MGDSHVNFADSLRERGGAEGIIMVPVNHFEPSTSAIPSCLRVSSLLKFVIPNWSANPKVWSSGALGGIFPCRHPWLETVTPYHRAYGPTW